MAWTVTLLELQTEIRERGGYRRSTSLTNDILTRFINKGIAKLHQIMVDHNPDFLLKRTNPDLTTTPGSDLVQLPGDFFKLRGRPLRIIGDRALKVMEFDLDDETELVDLDLFGSDRVPYRYMLQAGNLRLVPAPTTADTIRLWYLPHATKLVNPADVYDGQNGHEDFIIEWALKQAAEKDRRPAGDHVEAILALEQQLKSAVAKRDQSGPDYLIDHGKGWPLLG